MSLEITPYIESKHQSDEDIEVAPHTVYFIERAPQPEGEVHPLIESRQEIQRMLAWLSLVEAQVGPMKIEYIAKMMKNNEQRREQGVHVAVTDNFRFAPVLDDTDIMRVSNFLKNVPLADIVNKPHLHIVEEE